MRPIRESLSRVDEKLQRVETERQGHYASLTKHLEIVATANRDLGKQTQNLAQALGTPNTRGRWGELQLRRVVELAGMLDASRSRSATRQRTLAAAVQAAADSTTVSQGYPPFYWTLVDLATRAAQAKSP